MRNCNALGGRAFAVCVIAMAGACAIVGGQTTMPSTQPASVATRPAGAPLTPYIFGADISSVQAAEARGITTYSDNGVQKDVLHVLKDHGFNYVRLRVFNDPTARSPQGAPYSTVGFCDLPHTIAMARRVKALDMGLLIDFHYSDSWADPGKQYTPVAWANLPFDQLVTTMHDWTADAIRQFKAAGAEPDIVQIGNEITPGLMIDHGGSARDWVQLGRLLKAGIGAVKSVDPNILCMLHIDRGGSNPATRNWVDNALAQGVAFDILGESCYPNPNWQGPPDGWRANFNSLVKQYPQLYFVIAETSYETAQANDIMHSLPNHRGLGTFIWEPTQNGNGQSLFTGRAVNPLKMQPYDDLVRAYAVPTTRP
jgi:arabinogalactan endo-1,4-beta-galactosidase